MRTDEAYKAWLVRREASHPVPALMREQRYAFLRARFGLATGATILDVGSGHGFSAGADWATTVRLDIDEALLLRRDFTGVRVVGSADTLPFTDQSFDLVTLWEVLHHLAHPVAALHEALRVGHHVAIFEPNRTNPAVWTLAWITGHRRLLWPAGRLEASLWAAGAATVEIHCGGWIMPNATPRWLLPLLRFLPYQWRGGISLIALAT